MSCAVTPVGVSAQGFGWTHAGRTEPALTDVDFSIEPGQRVLLAGPSGAGKSTLLAAMAGVLGGDEEGTRRGQIWLETATGHREAPGRSIPVGLVLQDPDSQVIAATVGDDVAFGCENLGIARQDIWPRVHRALEVVGLDVDLNHPTAHLSGGQKQRLALAGVIAMGAGLILLDEPTANLDPHGAREVITAVKDTADLTGATVIVVEHTATTWGEFFDRALVIDADSAVRSAGVAGSIGKQKRTGLPRARTLSTRPEPALWARQLVTAFGPPRTADIPQGISSVVTGANGTGKSTWFLTMAGLLPARGGELGVAESVRRGLGGSPHTWRSAQLAHRIGFVFQNPEHQFLATTVREELEIGPRVMGESVPAARIDELAQRLRLTHLMSANPFTLSGGEKRRLSVATALVAAPQVVLLDEPTFGQDPETFGELVAMVRSLADAGVTVASITHDRDYIAALGDHRIHFEAEG